MTNAHLDNEKQSLRYQADLLRDQVDDMTEHNTELHRELRDKTRVSLLTYIDYVNCAYLLTRTESIVLTYLHGLRQL